MQPRPDNGKKEQEDKLKKRAEALRQNLMRRKQTQIKNQKMEKEETRP